MHSFHTILHDDMYEKLTTFLSMPCCCIFKNEFLLWHWACQSLPNCPLSC